MSIFGKKKNKNIFMGKRKVVKFLEHIDRDKSNGQIDLLKMYVSGELELILQKYNFEVIEVYVDKLRNHYLDLQINLRYQNKNIGLDFLTEYYEFCFYLAGCHPEDVESSIVRYDYMDFDLNTLLKDMESSMVTE